MPKKFTFWSKPTSEGKESLLAPNPFPATAVARLSETESEFWSIETEALKEAKKQLRDYLQRAASEQADENTDSKGVVLAIVGDYGTGKTHIAQDMLRQICAERNPRLHPFI